MVKNCNNSFVRTFRVEFEGERETEYFGCCATENALPSVFFEAVCDIKKGEVS